VQWPDSALAQDFLARFTGFETGAPYRAEDLLELQSKLNNSNYFSTVVVEPRVDLATHDEVPVEVSLEPRKPHRYSFGLGYGTDTGPRGRAAWQRPFINERGHRLDSDLRVSPILSSLSGTYGIPLQRPDIDALSFTTSVLNESTDVSDTTRAQLGAAHLTTRFGWQETLTVDYELERFDVGNDTETTGLLIPSARWSRIWADDPRHTRRGLRLGLDVRGAQSSLLSRISFLRVRIDGKFIQALGSGRVIARGEFGATTTSDFDKLPVTQRFFAGGDNSLRGFDYRSLGPRDKDGKVVGGRYLALGSLELEHEIRGAWSGAVFSDFGNAVDSLSDPFEYSVGAGLRWQSPIGPLRVDIANGISDEDKPWRLHIVVGPDL
jgi:translocation and assembly module TamA